MYGSIDDEDLDLDFNEFMDDLEFDTFLEFMMNDVYFFLLIIHK